MTVLECFFTKVSEGAYYKVFYKGYFWEFCEGFWVLLFSREGRGNQTDVRIETLASEIIWSGRCLGAMMTD